MNEGTKPITYIIILILVALIGAIGVWYLISTYDNGTHTIECTGDDIPVCEINTGLKIPFDPLLPCDIKGFEEDKIYMVHQENCGYCREQMEQYELIDESLKNNVVILNLVPGEQLPIDVSLAQRIYKGSPAIIVKGKYIRFGIVDKNLDLELQDLEIILEEF